MSSFRQQLRTLVKETFMHAILGETRKARKTNMPLAIEPLEGRHMLNGDGFISLGFRHLDVNGDNFVTPHDALAVINKLQEDGGSSVFQPFQPGKEVKWWDVTGDGYITPIDALNVINYVNINGAGPAPMPSLPNFAPVAYNMHMATGTNGSVSFVPAILDPESQALTVTHNLAATAGTLSVTNVPTWTFQAPQGFTGTVQFEMRGTDPAGLSATSIITVDVGVQSTPNPNPNPNPGPNPDPSVASHFVGPKISRAAVIYVAVMENGGVSGTPTGQSYTDISASYWAYGQIETAKAKGWLSTGVAVGPQLDPERNATIAEALLSIVESHDIPGSDFMSAGVERCITTVAQLDRPADHIAIEEFFRMEARASMPNACSATEEAIDVIARAKAARYGVTL